MHPLVIVEIVYTGSPKEYYNLEKSSVMSSVTYKSIVLSSLARKEKGNGGFNVKEVKGEGMYLMEVTMILKEINHVKTPNLMLFH